MFTGIVEEIGRIRTWHRSGRECQLVVECRRVLEGSRIGDSIAVNGVCLTARQLGEDFFQADILVETWDRTALREIKQGQLVNLERALAVGGRLGGHFVTGHVDGVGQVASMRREGNSLWMDVSLPDHLRKYVVPKGSVALDGVSLTIARLQGCLVSVCLVGHTVQQTILGAKRVGDPVNIETDILGKYVVHGQTPDFLDVLQSNGFA